MGMQVVQNNKLQKPPVDQVKKIKIHLGVFFDGTKNNKFNITEYNKRDHSKWWIQEPVKRTKWTLNDSYKREFTNVAKLFEVYDIDKKEEIIYKRIYVEGIATAPRENENDPGGSDSMTAAATGMGPYGVNGKVERACRLVGEKIQSIIKSQPEQIEITVEELQLDVFGFSRGATAARRFVSCIEKASGDIIRQQGGYISLYMVSLRDRIKQLQLKVENIYPHFMGLFDTVSSYGFNFTDDVKELTLHVRLPKFVVQFAAADEYRKNFALTRIKSANSNQVELLLPGDHCDVGGSYNKDMTEKTVITPEKIIYSGGDYYKIPPVYNGYKSLEKLLEEGWIIDKTEKERVVSNEYSSIPLMMMGKYAEEKRTTFFSDDLMDVKIPNDLTALKKRLDGLKGNPLYCFATDGNQEYIEPAYQNGDSDFELLRSIRHKYLHLSAQGGLVNGPAKNNKRLIIDDTK